MPHLKKVRIHNKPLAEYTFGKAVPKTNRQACYDPSNNTYTREACGKNRLISQGIGSITAQIPSGSTP